jgi:hypothetical protein
VGQPDILIDSSAPPFARVKATAARRPSADLDACASARISEFVGSGGMSCFLSHQRNGIYILDSLAVTR